MRAPRIDQPVRLGWGFLWVYLAALGVFLWWIPPWHWKEPLLTELSGALVLPFLAALAAYCTFLFIYSLLTDFSEQRVAFGFFLVSVAAELVAMAVVYLVPSLPRIRWYVPCGASLLVLVLCRPMASWARRSRAKGTSVLDSAQGQSDPF
jgi:hypothetical protein